MSEPEPENKPEEAAIVPDRGVRVFVSGIHIFVILLFAWWGLLRLVTLSLSKDKIDPVTNAFDIVGAIVVAIAGFVGLNYVTWKFVESAWVRWFVFGIEGAVLLFFAYALLVPHPAVSY